MRRATDLGAIDDTAAQRKECSASCSVIIRTARARTSGENLFIVLLVIDPYFSRVGVSGKSGPVHSLPETISREVVVFGDLVSEPIVLLDEIRQEFVQSQLEYLVDCLVLEHGKRVSCYMVARSVDSIVFG